VSLRLSVIVPVWRHWPQAQALLDRLAAQTLAPARFEVILVDNEPAAPPPPLASAALAVRVVEGPIPGSYAARNAGAAAARGEWLVFTDADCLPEPGWLAGYAAAIAAGRGRLLAGPVRMVVPPDPDPWAIYDLVRGIPQARYVARGYATTANLAVEAAAFCAVGGFEPARFSGGDAVFCRRAARLGFRVRLVEAAVVAHPARAGRAETVAKARRIKGGQIAVGPLPRRLSWTLRSLCPPLRDAATYIASPHPLRFRLTALGVRFRLWGIELAELFRLLAGGAPERR
jgi:GT2 family glycosyltransferase